MSSRTRAELYNRYPLSSILLYNGVTFAHFSLGGIGMVLGYGASWAGFLLGSIYLAFSLVQMYVIMPLTVCPNCFYYGVEGSRCASALNLLSTRIADQGDPQNFARRAQGVLCHNKLYMAALFAPIILILPALILNFSFLLLGIWVAVLGLLLFRFFVIFGQIACLHCKAKYECPNAERSGVRDR